MRQFSPVVVLTPMLAALLLGACDLTSPGSDGVLSVRGVVQEENGAHGPPLRIEIDAWAHAAADPILSSIAMTDADGRFAVGLGAIDDSMVDSVHVRVIQADCEANRVTTIVRRAVSLRYGDELDLGVLDIEMALEPATVAEGADFCAAIALGERWDQEHLDQSWLAIWVDDISDSVRGRWRLNHQESVGDSYGYFSGTMENQGLDLTLRPQPAMPCTGIGVVMFSASQTGVIPPPAEVSSNGNCSIPDATVRFFEGAYLSEVLPPL